MLRTLIFCIYLLCSSWSFAQRPELSQYEYQQLSQAFKLLQEDNYSQAAKVLKSALPKVESKYAKALLYQNLAQVYLAQERYTKAIAQLRTAKKLNALPEAQQLSIEHTLGQLYCVRASWKPCIRHLKVWMAAVPKQVKPRDHLLAAQAYSQLEQWSKLLSHISKAIAGTKQVPESWYQLKVVAHIHLKQWPKATKQQAVLVQHYSDKADNWRQLVSLQQQNEQPKAALASQRLGFQRGILNAAQDYVLLAQMLLQQQIPYQAAVVLQQGLEEGVLKASIKNLKMLSQAWVLARETDQAIATLKRLNQLSPSEQNATQLAQMLIQKRQWRTAQTTLQKAIKQSQKPAKLQLLLGITQLNLKQYTVARELFLQAAKNPKYARAAEGWLDYLEQLPRPQNS